MECICLLCVRIFSLCASSLLLGCKHLESNVGVYLLLVASANESRQMRMHIGLGLRRPFLSPWGLGLSFPHLRSEEAGLDDPQGLSLPKL